MSNDNQSKLERLIAEYLEAVEGGESPDRDSIVTANPDIANELNSFFTNHDAIQAANDDATRSLKEPPSEQPTIVPNPHDDATIPPTDSAADTEPTQTTGPGTTIKYFGDYELLEEIARGGMGVVYKAKQTKLNRVVALKMILAGQLASEDDVKRFYTEAEAAANLDHPGIVPIHEIGEHDGQHYFSMSFVEGDSLADRIKDGPLPPREAAEITKKVAEAIAYAHERGVIHRDLKPGNILMDANGEPRVTDFGLAKKVEGDSDLTATGQILGTPSYMPPEQAAGKIDEIDERADVYSLGAILYALLTGRPPFQAASAIDTLMQVMEQEPVSPRVLNADVPVDLETICLKLLEKNLRQRYGAASELVGELSRFLNGEPIKSRPIGTMARGWRWCKRKPAVACLGLGLLATFLVGIFSTSTLWLRAENRGAQTRQRLYVSNINLATQALEVPNVGRAVSLLDAVRPSKGQEDLRGFEWYYLWRQCHLYDATLAGHTNFVPCVSYCDRTNVLATGSFDTTVRIWDASNGNLLRTLDGHSASVLSVAFSPDGETLATVAVSFDLQERVYLGELYLWDVTSGQAKATEFARGSDPILSVCFSPDGDTLATGCGGTRNEDNGILGVWGDVKLWSLNTLELKSTWEHQGPVSCVGFSKDGSKMAALSDSLTSNGELKIWDIGTGLERDVETAGRCMCFAFSPNGGTLASSGVDAEKGGDIIQLWDVDTGGLKKTLRGHTKTVSSISFSPDGKSLASASYDRTLRIWDTAKGDERMVLVGHLGLPQSLTFCDRGNRLVSAGGMFQESANAGEVKLWDLTAAREWTTGSTSSVHVAQNPFGISPGGKTLAIQTRENIELRDRVTGAIKSTLNGFKGTVFQYKWDAEMLAVSNLRQPGELCLWNLDAPQKPIRINGLPFPVQSIAFSPNREIIAVSLHSATIGAPPGVVKLWDARNGTEKLTIQPAGGGRGIVFSPDGRVLIAGVGKTLRFWDSVTGEQLRVVEAHDQLVLSLALSPDGQFLASAGKNGLVKLWQTATGALVAELDGHVDEVYFLAFSPDGRTLATGTLRAVKLWNLATCEVLMNMKHRHSDRLQSLVFSRDSKLLLTNTKYWCAASHDNHY